MNYDLGTALTLTYAWIKAAHVIFVIFWIAGLFMLQRYYVYHQEAAAGSAEEKRWIERERKLQAEVFGRLLDPMDSVLDLLEESGKTFRAQADALAEASAALEQTATLMQTQAEIYDSAIKALRDGHHGYTPAQGILPLREAVAADLSARRGVEVSPANIVIMEVDRLQRRAR